MESINKTLKRDASYASPHMVVDMSVTIPTNNLAMRANISRVDGMGDKLRSPQQSDCIEVGVVDNSLSLPLNNSKYVEITPFEKPFFEKAIMSGKSIEESLGVARKALFTMMKERTSAQVTRSPTSGDSKRQRFEDASPQKNQPVHKLTSNVGGIPINLLLVPCDINNAPLSFAQMEKIQATIIDMMIEHNSREINAETLNCQFKTGWMAFKCTKVTAEWLKRNCDDISKRCKVKMLVVQEFSKEEKIQTNSTPLGHLKKSYYSALHHLRKIKLAQHRIQSKQNANVTDIKYAALLKDYVKTQNNIKKIKKLLVIDGVFDKSKNVKPLHQRYHMALQSLNRLKKLEQSGTRLDEKKLMSRRRLQAVVNEYLREQRKSKKLTNLARPFREVTTDPLCVAVGSRRNGLFVPIPNEWPIIQTQINELVTSYILENEDDSPLPRYDLNEVHRGFRVIKCLDEFSKKFLFKCITTIKDKWKDLNLMIIPASQIPKGRRDLLDLKATASSTASAGNMDFQRSQKYNETRTNAALHHTDHGMAESDNFPENLLRRQSLAQRPQSSNPFRSSDFQTPQHCDLTEKTFNTSSHGMAQQPQTSRTTAEFSLRNCSNPLRSSNFRTHPYTVSNKVPENIIENSSFREKCSPASRQTKNYLDSGADLEFNDRFSERNKSSRRPNDRNPSQTQSLTKIEDRWKTCDVADNSGLKRQFHQDSSPDCSKSSRIDRFPAYSETSRRSGERSEAQRHVLMNSEDWRRSPDFYANSGSNKSQFYQDSLTDYSISYNNDGLSAYNDTSRRGRGRNRSQTHVLINSEDWQRSPDFYENSRSNVTKFYPDSPTHCNNSHRNERLLQSNEFSRQSWERNPVQSQTLTNSDSRWKSSDFYKNSNSPPDYNSRLYRNEKDYNETSTSTLMEECRKSPDLHAKLTPSYEDFPHHYSNTYRNSSPSASFRNRYPEEDTFHMLPNTEPAKYNVRSKESYRSNEFHDVSHHWDFESFPNYSSQPDPRKNNWHSRTREKYLPSDDGNMPPPPPRWN